MASDMLIGAADKCTDDACTPNYSHTWRTSTIITTAFASIPFLVTFGVILALSVRRIFPYLSPGAGRLSHSRISSVNNHITTAPSSLYRRIACSAFSVTLAATAVLAQLILCEIIDLGHKRTRWLWFRTIVNLLLLMLIVVTPILELHALIGGERPVPTVITRSNVWAKKRNGVVKVLLFGGWIWAFYKLGDHVPIPPMDTSFWSERSVSVSKTAKGLSEECLSRVGVIGVTLMAVLSGFGSISSPWQSFTTKPKVITEGEVRRIQGGIEATAEMLEMKQNKLSSLERKISASPTKGFMSKMMGSIRGNPDHAEASALRMEISGLSTMQQSLQTDLSTASSAYTAQSRAHTAWGRFLAVVQVVFSIYCLYRISSTLFLRFPSLFSSSASAQSTFSQRDPINNVLAIIAKHYDPHLDRLAWSRNIGFLFSGVIIFGSINSVITTFAIVTKAAPGVWGHTGLALAVGQLTAIYVVSSAVLLRSSLPKDMGSVLGSALGVMLDVGWVDRWFDSMFLGGAGVTLVVLIVSKKMAGGDGYGFDDDLLDRGDKQC